MSLWSLKWKSWEAYLEHGGAARRLLSIRSLCGGARKETIYCVLEIYRGPAGGIVK